VIFLAIAIAGAVVSSFVLSLLATRLCEKLAWRVGMVDRPGLHKSHAQPTALLGGLAIFAAILLPSVAVLALAKIWAVAGPPSWLPAELAGHIPGAASKIPQALGIGLAGAWLVLLGLIDDKFHLLIDDKFHLGPWVKMMAQFVAAGFVVIFCDVRILTLIGRGLFPGRAELSDNLSKAWPERRNIRLARAADGFGDSDIRHSQRHFHSSARGPKPYGRRQPSFFPQALAAGHEQAGHFAHDLSVHRWDCYSSVRSAAHHRPGPGGDAPRPDDLHPYDNRDVGVDSGFDA